MAQDREQKVVIAQADFHKERDVTSRVKEYLDEGWSIESASATPMGDTFVGLVFVLGRDRRSEPTNQQVIVR